MEPHVLQPQELVLRLLLAGVFGAIVGFEREYRDRTAGLRTHMLVCIGSAAFTIISAYAFTGPEWVSDMPADMRPNLMSDPSRIAAQIVSGIGFLGAGAIFQSRGSVRGLTTAASLWAMAAIGMAVGAGEYGVAATCTLVIVFTLAVLRQTSRRIKRLHRTERTALDLHIVHDRAYRPVFDTLAELRTKVSSLSMEPSERAGSDRRLTLEVDLPAHVHASEVAARLIDLDGVEAVSAEGSTGRLDE